MSKNKVRLVSTILSIAMIGLMFVVGVGVIKKINLSNAPVNATCCCNECNTNGLNPCKCENCKCKNCGCMYAPK